MPERHRTRRRRVSLFALLLGFLSPLIALLVGMVASPSEANALVRVFGALVVMSTTGAIMVARRLFSRGPGSPPGSSDSGDGGGGWGPRQPPPPPDAPRGGIPLPDAEPARIRVRGHDRPDRRRVQPRRPAREPDRSPRVS